MNADAAALRVWLHRGLGVEQVPRADAAKGPLALKPLLGVHAQLSQRRGAAVPVLFGKVLERVRVHEASAFKVDEGPLLVEKAEVRIGVHEAPAFKVDEGDLFTVAGAPHCGR